MPDFDPYVPRSLKTLQEWFGNIISAPLVDNDKIAPFSPHQTPIEEEAKRYVAPSPTLKPFERLQIYNQQYWWRLLGILHEAFPLNLRLFSYADFNQSIAIPYLVRYPPSHWSLNTLGESMSKWIDAYYDKDDKQLVYDAVVLDEAFSSIFFKPLLPSLSADDPALLSAPLYTQPHVVLVTFDYNLLAFRDAMLQHPPDHWIEAPFPDLKKEKTHFMINRSKNGFTEWKTISSVEKQFLKLFENGSTLDEACEWIEKQPKKIRAEAETSLQNWFAGWTFRGILTTHAPC